MKKSLEDKKYEMRKEKEEREYEKKLIHKVEALRTETGTKKALWLTMITFSGKILNAVRSRASSE